MAVKELKVFDQKLYTIVHAITDTIIPPGGAFVWSNRRTRSINYVLNMSYKMPVRIPIF